MFITPPGYPKLFALLVMAAAAAVVSDDLFAASPKGSNPKIEAAIKVINPDAVVHSVRDIPGLGLKEVTANNSVVYMDPNGRYLFFGTLLDMEAKRNLSEEAQGKARILALEAIPNAEKIIYEPSNVLHRVTVFTDVSCSFCQRLHQRVSEYNDRGIAIEYVAYPRGGERNPAWQQMRSVWCSEDRKAAFDSTIAGKPVTAASCDDPLKSHYTLGESLSFEGTPAIYTESGRHINGFMEPDRLLVELEKEKAKQKVAQGGGK